MVDDWVSMIGASEVTTISPVAAAISRLKVRGTELPALTTTASTRWLLKPDRLALTL